MDTIRLTGIQLYGCHGVSPAEREIGRPFEVDIELTLDLSAAAETDDLGKTVDYGAVCALVRTVHEAGPYQLLEAFAGQLAKNIINLFHVEQVVVCVRKPHPPVGSVIESAEVELVRRRGE